jgi:hypothetical protein
MLEVTTDSDAAHARTERCSRKATRQTHDNGVLFMPGILAADVKVEMHLFIESKAMRSEGNVFAGELAASMCVCWQNPQNTHGVARSR